MNPSLSCALYSFRLKTKHRVRSGVVDDDMNKPIVSVPFIFSHSHPYERLPEIGSDVGTIEVRRYISVSSVHKDKSETFPCLNKVRASPRQFSTACKNKPSFVLL